ncbi:efflux RND transporter periplasmic adaptor subunit [Roseovarius sp. 2305UL8-3]|uniref:efflux RND transporter periplasmic adaptor subunit n=1 Tax=Roseovarius conchicola TaxID=3121636 RepID=UPI0035299637
MMDFCKRCLMILGLGLVASGVMAQEAEMPDAVRPAKVVAVEATESTIRRSYPAIVLPSDEVELSFRVSGRLEELPVRGSMDVAEGDMIARLDLRDFESQVAQLESQRDQAVAQLDALKSGARTEEIAALEAAVASAQAQLDQAREQRERTAELVEREVAAEAVLEQDDANLRVAEANLQAQQEQLAIGRAGGRAEDIAASEAALRGLEAQLKVARDNLDDATLRSPFNGVIARRDVDNFTNVQAGQSIVLLQALDTVDLIFDVPGPDVTALTAGGRENIRNQVMFDALPGEVFDSEIVEFSLQADSATQTYRGRVNVEQPETAVILPGMVGRVITSAPGNGSQLMIPLTALAAASDGTTFVWLVGADNTTTRRDITLGEATGDRVVVLEGLAEGDVVVAAGVSSIMEGMAIRPITRVGG